MEKRILEFCEEVARGKASRGDCDGICCQECPFGENGVSCYAEDRFEGIKVAIDFLTKNKEGFSGDDMKSKNFKEVIATIKEGEVWESNNKTIECFRGDIIIMSKEELQGSHMAFVVETQYFLKGDIPKNE